MEEDSSYRHNNVKASGRTPHELPLLCRLLFITRSQLNLLAGGQLVHIEAQITGTMNDRSILDKSERCLSSRLVNPTYQDVSPFLIGIGIITRHQRHSHRIRRDSACILAPQPIVVRQYEELIGRDTSLTWKDRQRYG